MSEWLDDEEDPAGWQPVRSWYDLSLRMWVCECGTWIRTGRCLHVRILRREEILKVREEYL